MAVLRTKTASGQHSNVRFWARRRSSGAAQRCQLSRQFRTLAERYMVIRESGHCFHSSSKTATQRATPKRGRPLASVIRAIAAQNSPIGETASDSRVEGADVGARSCSWLRLRRPGRERRPAHTRAATRLARAWLASILASSLATRSSGPPSTGWRSRRRAHVRAPGASHRGARLLDVRPPINQPRP
jgi:hypothetical protein